MYFLTSYSSRNAGSTKRLTNAKHACCKPTIKGRQNLGLFVFLRKVTAKSTKSLRFLKNICVTIYRSRLCKIISLSFWVQFRNSSKILRNSKYSHFLPPDGYFWFFGHLCDICHTYVNWLFLILAISDFLTFVWHLS